MEDIFEKLPECYRGYNLSKMTDDLKGVKMSIDECLKYIDYTGGFIDDDYYIDNVLVNGYLSNIIIVDWGLRPKSFNVLLKLEELQYIDGKVTIIWNKVVELYPTL